jgi:NitT/TauT family transport system substrate-binding protein
VDSGEFAAAVEPANLETRVFNAGPALIEAIFAGEIDVGYVGPAPILNAQRLSGGKAVRVIAGASANGVVIVARKGSGIRTLRDLKDRLIATPQAGNSQDIAARHFLLHQLRQQNTQNVLPTSSAEQLTLMRADQLDAAWAPEPLGSRLIVEGGATLLAEEKSLWPDGQFALALVITTPEFLSAHRQLLGGLLRAHSRWTRRLREHPNDFEKPLDAAIARLTGKTLPPGVIAMALPRVQFTDDRMPHTLKMMADWSYQVQARNGAPNLDGLIDRTLLSELGAPTVTSNQER